MTQPTSKPSGCFMTCFIPFCCPKKKEVKQEVKQVAKKIAKTRVFAPHPKHRKMLVSTEIVNLAQVLREGEE